MTLIEFFEQKGFNWGYSDQDAKELSDFLDNDSTDIDSQNSSGDTALVRACYIGNPKIAKTLLEHGTNPNLANIQGKTALMLACDRNDFETIETLLEKNANPNLADKKGDTALMNACIYSNAKTVKIFFEFGADPNLANEKGDTALIFACKNRDFKTVETLLKHGANPNIINKEGETALTIACKYGASKVVKTLLENGANPNAQDKKGLVAMNHIIRYVSKFEVERIFFAIKRYNYKLNINDDGSYLDNYPNELIAKIEECINNVKPGADILKRFEQDVRNIISPFEEREMIQYLISYGADISALNGNRDTLLMHFDKNYNSRGVEILLKVGASKFELSKNREEYFDDQSRDKNISHHSGDWGDLVNAIIASVKNRELNKYPYVTRNADNSISFFVSRDFDEDVGNYNREFQNLIGQKHIVNQLEYQIYKKGFKTIDNRIAVETTYHDIDDIDEYRINLSAENFDSILKLNPTYVGYRNEGGLLKLVKDFSLKKGAIRMFPAFPIDQESGHYAVQAAGCNVYEMPTVQLMHLLPNCTTKSNYFHWIPEEVEKRLGIDRSSFPEIFHKLFNENGNAISFKDGDEGMRELKINNNSEANPIKIVPMDDDSKWFYALYGNTSMEEAGLCCSVEISTIDLLKAVEEFLYNDAVANAEKLKTIQQMIANELEVNVDEKKEGEKKVFENDTSPPSSSVAPHRDEERKCTAIPLSDKVPEPMSKIVDSKPKPGYVR